MTVAGRCEKRTESEIIAAQIKVLQTRSLETQILQKKRRAKAEQRKGFDDRVQHTKAHSLMKRTIHLEEDLE